MTTLEKELVQAGLLTSGKQNSKFETSVEGMTFKVKGTQLIITTESEEEIVLTIPAAVQVATALRDAMAVMIANNRHNF